MALFQKAPSTAEEYEHCKPLEIGPDEVLKMDEAEWYARVYRGDSVPQLTIRAVVMGSLLGFFLAFTNLYIGLKTGWHLGVAITACILSFSIWNGLLKARLARTPMSILEMNCMQSTASAAGYSTGGTMVSAIAALLMLSATQANPGGTHLSWPILALWTFFLAMLGVMLAIPMKRNMINQEKLRFPSGTAAAVTLQSLYSEGREAIQKAKALFIAGGLGILAPVLMALNLRKVAASDGTMARHPLLPESSALFDWLPGRSYARADATVATKPSDWTIVMDHNLVMVAAGALVGLRVAVSMVIGGLLLAYVIGPLAAASGWVDTTGTEIFAASSPGRAWREIGIWVGAPIMVASGLLFFLFGWKTIVRAFTAFAGTQTESDEEALIAKTEVPTSWFLAGALFSGGAIVWIANAYFEVPLHLGALAVLLSFILALVACRATGESDITPTGAMGKIMQLTYGILIPKSSTANLMSAGITAGSAGASADLLNDLKSGYLLGANPRRQWVAQFLGIFTGTAATVAGFYLLIPDATALTGEMADGSTVTPDFPAPAAQAWSAVARLFEVGLANMHPMFRAGILWGLLAGAAMVVAEKALPKYKNFLPSATGIGLGFILPFQYPLSMFIGALAAWMFLRANKKQADRYTIPISSGIIAGESLMGVFARVLNTFVLI